MNAKYPTFVGEIAKRGIKKKDIAKSIGISERAFRNKISGKTAFTWPEAEVIQNNFFSDVEIGKLFASADDDQGERDGT